MSEKMSDAAHEPRGCPCPGACSAADTIEVMRLALNYALPIVEKYAHTQGDNAAFHAKITEPLRAALNGPPQVEAEKGSDR